MPFIVHNHYEQNPTLGELLEVVIRQNHDIARMLRALYAGEIAMSADLSELQAAVENDATVDQSAITLLNGLAQQLRDAQADPAAIAALADQLDSQSADLAAAVTANTPAAPEPTPSPAPVDEPPAEAPTE